MQAFFQRVNDFFETNGRMLLNALIILVVGLVVIRVVLTLVKRGLGKTKLDPLAFPYIRSGIKIVLYVVLFISVMSQLGFSPGSLVTLLGTAGLALSLALQNSLSNMVNGIFLMLSRPFAQGDYVSINGVEGTVKGIGLIYTTLDAVNDRVMVPNSEVASAKIIDYSSLPKRRCDAKFFVAADADIERLRRVALDAAGETGMMLTDPEPKFVVLRLLPVGAEVSLQVWVENRDYWPYRNQIFERLQRAMAEAKISLPQKGNRPPEVEPASDSSYNDQ